MNPFMMMETGRILGENPGVLLALVGLVVVVLALPTRPRRRRVRR